MADALDKAIQKYSLALQRRLKSREKLHHAEIEEKRAAADLSNAKEALRALEMELCEAIVTPGLVLSSDVSEAQH